METIELNNFESALGGVGAVARRAQRELGVLDDQLLSLRLNFGKLRASLERAFAPVTATVVPVVNSALRELTDFCDDAGAVIAALFGTVYKKAVTTAKSTGSAVRRTLASFDEIQRLNGGSGGGSGGSTVTYEPVNDPLTPQLQAVVDKLRAVMAKIDALLEPLRHIDLTPAAESFRALGQAISSLGGVILEGLEWAWFNLLVPLAQWVLEDAVPLSVDALTAAFKALTAVLGPVLSGIGSVLTALQPVAAFLAGTAVRALQGVSAHFSAMAQAVSGHSATVEKMLHSLAGAIGGLLTRAEPVLFALREIWSGVMTAMSGAVTALTEGAITALSGLTAFLEGIFSGSWEQAWNGLKTVMKGCVNGIIGLLNSLLSGMAAGINGICAALNKWGITVPEWVPAIGGKHFGFQLKGVTAPQIPYLAQGAVLPANKPFLAMVGDQRHGTNVEAPLATIQEAVATVMQDQTAAMMAGFNASVEVQREILQAVLGIRIGDEMIAAAYDRCRAREAVMKGGRYAP